MHHWSFEWIDNLGLISYFLSQPLIMSDGILHEYTIFCENSLYYFWEKDFSLCALFTDLKLVWLIQKNMMPHTSVFQSQFSNI